MKACKENIQCSFSDYHILEFLAKFFQTLKILFRNLRLTKRKFRMENSRRKFLMSKKSKVPMANITTDLKHTSSYKRTAGNMFKK